MTLQTLADTNQAPLVGRRTADETAAEAAAEVDLAFALLSEGLAVYR